ncbi:hypothetical protein H6B32_11630 [Bacteroides gallinaceum]|uniref:hypothetical protein n=1 Tax=Bacteroides gallinaceum TaxID=1462571 RepID=UPI0019564717|nr:hypothetical protein [Bacteroides gallinaceum]MBM6945816.1 hypothetical protein [Bacteroides gallinaceum]
MDIIRPDNCHPKLRQHKSYRIDTIRGSDMGAQMQQPLAVAVIGGFVAGLPLLLVGLPALMRRIYR